MALHVPLLEPSMDSEKLRVMVDSQRGTLLASVPAAKGQGSLHQHIKYQLNHKCSVQFNLDNLISNQLFKNRTENIIYLVEIL